MADVGLFGAYPCTHVLVTAGTLLDVPATAGAVEARIDPAAPSATIAEMMTDRRMRMIPPWRLPRSVACCATSLSCLANLTYSAK
jgi:hypothetical protein